MTSPRQLSQHAHLPKNDSFFTAVPAGKKKRRRGKFKDNMAHFFPVDFYPSLKL
jgi:hypothetical protein